MRSKTKYKSISNEVISPTTVEPVVVKTSAIKVNIKVKGLLNGKVPEK
jgi:hypothetical protein